VAALLAVTPATAALLAVTPATAALLAVTPATAAAADQTVQAVDANGTVDNSWSPASVAIDVGDTVTWTFPGPPSTAAHNVESDSANWTLASPIALNHPPVSYTFTASGNYAFVCRVHPGTMKGTVTVGNVPPPPPPPLSQQPFPNDQPAPTVLEITDDTRPTLSRVRVARIGHGVRVRFRVSEPARVTVRAKRGRRTVKSTTVRLTRAGSRAVTLRGLRAGRYRIDVLARDSADNRSHVKRARLTVGH
jgi:plastocyanin